MEKESTGTRRATLYARLSHVSLALLRASRKGFSFVRPPFTPPLQLTRTRVAQAGVPCYLQCYRDATVEEGEGGLFSFSFPFGAR